MEATIENVKIGTMLVADGGFTCIEHDALLEVKADHDGELYVPCSDGKHYLDGQIGDDGFTYVGFITLGDG